MVYGSRRTPYLVALYATSERVSKREVHACMVTDLPHVVWEIWTNGLYKSTLHRVVHRGSNYR